MKQNLVKGISLLGVALTATGLFASAQGWGKWALILSAGILTIMGIIEISNNK